MLAVYLRGMGGGKRGASAACGSVGGMDKKEINSPRMTLNFLIWVGGVFMLLLFGFLAHFVWKIL
jgi:hypothetical protein